MRLAFDETMTGRTDDGRRFAFAITASADDAPALLLGEPLTISGSVDLEGVARGTPARGTLEIGPPYRRVLAYELSFSGDDGATYRYTGRKDVRYRHPVATMTRLTGTLFRDGTPVGRASLRFPLRDLPALLKSVRRLPRGAPLPP